MNKYDGPSRSETSSDQDAQNSRISGYGPRTQGTPDQIKGMNAQTRETQASMTPEKALDLLKEGNKRFHKSVRVRRDLLKHVDETSSGQFPFAVILSCIDSRVPSELIFDLGVGDIFSIRIAGNVVNEDILGSMEFGCGIAGSKLILVLGHASCGAVKGACDDVKMGHLTTLLEKLKPAMEAVDTTDEDRTSQNAVFVDRVAEANVHLTIEDIKQRSPVIKDMLDTGKIGIAGGMYDVKTGEVHFFD